MVTSAICHRNSVAIWKYSYGMQRRTSIIQESWADSWHEINSYCGLWWSQGWCGTLLRFLPVKSKDKEACPPPHPTLPLAPATFLHRGILSFCNKSGKRQKGWHSGRNIMLSLGFTSSNGVTMSRRPLTESVTMATCVESLSTTSSAVGSFPFQQQWVRTGPPSSAEWQRQKKKPKKKKQKENLAPDRNSCRNWAFACVRSRKRRGGGEMGGG